MSEANEPKKVRVRSPNHPSLSLKTAVEKAAALFEKYGREPAPMLTACVTIGYKSIYSTSHQAIAALKAYGLVGTTGKGNARKIAVTPEGERIIRKAPNRAELIKKAALEPQIHSEVFEHFDGKLPHDDIVRQYLLWERPEGNRFAEDTVDIFINRLRDTLVYSGLSAGDNNSPENVGPGDADTSNNGNDPESCPTDVQVGSFVQWTSAGVDRFSSPRRVVGFSDDKLWAFVEGSKSGVAMSELCAVESPIQDDRKPHPPANPHFVDSSNPPSDGAPYISFPLSDGNRFELKLDRRISPEDFARLRKVIELSEKSLVDNDGEE